MANFSDMYEVSKKNSGSGLTWPESEYANSLGILDITKEERSEISQEDVIKGCYLVSHLKYHDLYPLKIFILSSSASSFPTPFLLCQRLKPPI
jgi:hypothetical protein